MNRPSLGQERWTATELGAALCLSSQRINQLVKEGVLPAPFDGRYSPKIAVGAYIKHLERKDEVSSKAGEEVKKYQLENELRLIKLQKIASKLVPIARVQQDWLEHSGRVRRGLLDLPGRLAGVFAAESDQARIFDLFSREIHQTLTELSTRPAPAPVVGRLPLWVAAEPKQSTDQTEAMEEAGEHDVQDPEEIDGESTQ